jgi:hypothetical protein
MSKKQGQADKSLNGFVYKHPIFLSRNVQSHLGTHWMVALFIVFNVAIVHHHLKSIQDTQGNKKQTRMGVPVSLVTGQESQ